MESEAQSGRETKLQKRWRLRDTLAAAFLFAGSAAFVLWQNARVAVLWDLGYLLDTSWRIAMGQMPYRDFPLAHAPATFLIQAGLIKLFGRHYIVPVIYAAVVGGIGSVLTWRIVLRILGGAWGMSFFLAAPLVFIGVYAVYPHPIYDGDCAVVVLLALWLLMRVDQARGPLGPFLAGVACVLPLFCKQNMGLPLLAVVACGVGLIASVRWYPRLSTRLSGTRGLDVSAGSQSFTPGYSGYLPPGDYDAVLLGIVSALGLGFAAIAATAGLHNYVYWTVRFAAQRRLPGLGSMPAVYSEPSLVWTLPAVAIGLVLCWTRFVQRRWARLIAFGLVAAPFAWSLINLFLQDDPEERADNLLALWPLWMLTAMVVALAGLGRGITVRRLMPLFVLAAIHGALLSQRLWGSTYAIWPLLIVLIASVLAKLPQAARPAAVAMAAMACVTFTVCGGLYSASLDRLQYIDIPDAPPQHAQTPALRGMADRGTYLANLDELVSFSQREIPRNEALLLLPGEDPFYYATGRVPQFPVTLFDPATDPYSASQLMDEARNRGVQWVIVKRALQSNETVMPEAGATMRLVLEEFRVYRELNGYEVYRRK